MMRPAVVVSLLSLPIRWSRSICTTSVNFVKVLREKTEGDKTFVSGVHVDSDRKPRLAVAPAEARADACPLCKLGLKGIQYSDVLILSQFMTDDGKLMPISETKLCAKQYYKVKREVEMAQKCRLLPRPADYEVYGPWDKLNTYHDWPPRRRDVAKKCVQPYYWKNIDHTKY